MNVDFNQATNELIFMEDGEVLFRSSLHDSPNETKSFRIPYNQHVRFVDLDYLNVEISGVRVHARINNEDLLQLLGSTDLVAEALRLTAPDQDFDDDDLDLDLDDREDPVDDLDDTEEPVDDTPPFRPRYEPTDLQKAIRSRKVASRKEFRQIKYDKLGLYNLKQNLITAVINDDSLLEERISAYIEGNTLYNTLGVARTDLMNEFASRNEELIRKILVKDEDYIKFVKGSYTHEVLEHESRFTEMRLLKIAKRFSDVAIAIEDQIEYKYAANDLREHGWTVLRSLRFPEVHENIRQKLTLEQGVLFMERIADRRNKYASIINNSSLYPSSNRGITVEEILTDYSDLCAEYGMSLKFGFSKKSPEDYQSYSPRDALLAGIERLM